MAPPELRSVPTELLTPRLLLRCPRPGDGQALHGAVQASLPELRPWMPWAQHPLDAQGYEVNVLHAASRFLLRQELRYLIFDRSGATLLGSSGFHALDWRVPKAEIGYWVGTPHAGQGYATEAAGALTQFAFGTLGLRRVQIRCDATNAPSAAIPLRLGYTLEATLHHDEVAADDPGVLRDTLVFARTQ